MPTLLTHARRRTLRRTVAAGLLTGGATGAAAPVTASAASGAAIDAREANVISRVNDIRADHGLGALTASGDLSAAADKHSRRLRNSGTLSHQLPGEGRLRTRLQGAAAAKRPIGEVVLAGGGGMSSAAIVRAWMRSPGHRALLLSDDFGTAGVGIRVGRAGLFATVDLAAG